MNEFKVEESLEDMHNIKYIRDNAGEFDKAMARRGLGPQSPAILELDEERRALQTESQTLQAKRNEESKKIGQIKKEGGDADAQMKAVAKIKDQMGALEEKEKAKAEELHNLLAGLPNIMADDVPDGEDEDQNVERHKWGEIKSASGPDHVEIGEALGMIDFETAAKMSGARFTLLSGPIARLERALAQFFLDTHTEEHGLTEVSPPLLVRDSALFGTNQLPKFEEDLFECNSDVLEYLLKRQAFYEALKEINSVIDIFIDAEIDLSARPKIRGLKEHLSSKNEKLDEKYADLIRSNQSRRFLIPTSEVPLTNIVADSIVDEEYLPRRYCAFTPCFRSEAGSAGKDTRGMLRQHQFYKVEMVSVTAPEKSKDEHERMLGCAEAVLKKLELPFRTVTLCSGDTGFGATKTYDIEAWLPGQETYREISSVSNCGDFQARRMNARTRPKGTKDTRFVHTLNGSGVAVGRALIAVIENYYDPSDGGVYVPDVLKPYMGGIEKIVKQ